ncbi:NAD(P)/FAD-dependent oxidoreductase [soil metagenome]
MPTTYDVLGRVGLPAPVAELARQRWEVVVVGGGHNGLTAAAYLARAGRSVLVLERAERLGGACTLTEPWPDPAWKVSPCAYLVGLLSPLVIDELDLRRHGYRVHPADPHLWCPFEDGTSLALWNDRERSAAAIRAIGAPDADAKGYLAYEDLFATIRSRLRSPARDTWLEDSPSRDELEALLGHDPTLIDVVFEASIADVVEGLIADERVRTALTGQGCIGTWAGPRDPGIAGVHLMHSMGSLEGIGGGWGYVEGGMGRVAFALADAAREVGAVLATGVPVAAILPGEGVRLEGGEHVAADVVVSNADPKRTLGLLGEATPPDFRARLEGWSVESPVVKVNCGLSRLPTFSAAAEDDAPHRGMVTISQGTDVAQASFLAATRGEPAPDWCELYFHTAYDASIAPAGKHAMSVFAQYVPYTLAEGTWGERREEIGDRVLATVARFAPDVVDVIEEREVLGPPDIEARIGLTGGHIFQGDCRPEQMWDRRLSARTPVDGVYLCGAATHPGGSVIAANGRNAAMAVLADAAAGS